MTDLYMWFSIISKKQRFWVSGTAAIIIIIMGFGIIVNRAGISEDLESVTLNVDMSIRDIAPSLNVTGKTLAREFNLPIDVSKQKSLKSLGVTPEELQHVSEHLLSHRVGTLKYYIYAALVLGGLIFLVRLGRPDLTDVKHRRDWYPRSPYIVSLLLSAIVAGFLLGKSPNPMESAVKIFKTMVGLYPDPTAKAIAFFFFIVLAVAGNKIVCGWACPIGSLQELIYSIPILRRIKQRKLPFFWTNAIRVGLFAAMLLILFGIIGGRKGTVIYHNINPFNLFNLEFETVSILITVILTLLGSFFLYRPFCQIICPFGLVSWLVERFSIFRVRIDRDKCTECGVCIKVCPLEAAKGMVNAGKFSADCYSCARCLNVCPVDAIQYCSVCKKI